MLDTVPAVTTMERQGRTAVIHIRGDVVVPTVRGLHGVLRGCIRRRDIKDVRLDFSEVGHFDSSGVAVVELARRALTRAGKKLELDKLAEHHRAAFELVPKSKGKPSDVEPIPGWIEVLGDRILGIYGSLKSLLGLVREIVRQSWAIMMRRKRLPTGAVGTHVLAMGADAIFIVALLSFLLGTTVAFQGAVQLQRFGAGVFVGDMVGLSMVREFAPLMTAIVLTGRTGAAIAAELGTMRVGAEIDALTAMGVSPIRFLVVPRLFALTFVQPALTLMGMFIGVAGGMLVAKMILDMSPIVFWDRMVDRLSMWDFAQGLGKSFVFSWIIGLAGSHLGLSATGDASSVGTATTRTVVVSIFFIILVDATFATIITLTSG